MFCSGGPRVALPRCYIVQTFLHSSLSRLKLSICSHFLLYNWKWRQELAPRQPGLGCPDWTASRDSLRIRMTVSGATQWQLTTNVQWQQRHVWRFQRRRLWWSWLTRLPQPLAVLMCVSTYVMIICILTKHKIYTYKNFLPTSHCLSEVVFK